jgi:hypothetical protein
MKSLVLGFVEKKAQRYKYSLSVFRRAASGKSFSYATLEGLGLG